MKIQRKNTARGHYYIDLDAGNERVPGVTTILSDGLPKPALMNWNATATAAYAIDQWDMLAGLPIAERLKKIEGGRWAARDTAAARGTAVHAMAERLVSGEKVTVPDEITGYVKACVDLLDDFDVRAVHVESVVYSETHRHVGTCDLIAEFLLPDMPEYDHIPRRDNGYSLALVDWKTSKSGIFGDVALQLAAYRHSEYLLDSAGGVLDMPEVDFTAGIHLRPDGGYSLVPLTSDESIYRGFLYVKQVAQLVSELRDLVWSPIVPPTASQYVLTKAVDNDAEALRAEIEATI